MMKRTFTKWFALLALVVVAGAGVAYAALKAAAPSISADTDELYVKNGETKTITISLDNPTGANFYGLQTSIVVPAGFDVTVEALAGTARQSETDGKLQVVIYTADGKPLQNVKDVLKLSVTPSEKGAKGNLVLGNNVISVSADDDGGNPLTPEALSVADVKVAVAEGLAPAKNLDFEADEPVAKGISTYDKDKVEGGLSQAQPLSGWIVAEGTGRATASGNEIVGDGVAAGTFAYGSDAYLGGADYKAPAADPEGKAGKALGVVAVWTNKAQYTQEVTLEAGDYALAAPVYNAGGASAFTTNLIGVEFNGEAKYAETTQYPVGKWTNEYVIFRLDEETDVTLSVGYTSANSGSGAMPHLFIDGVKILTGEQYEAAVLATAQKDALDYLNSLPVGKEVFAFIEPDVTEAIAAVEKAETPEEVEAIVDAIAESQILPYSDSTPYTIQQVSSGLYLNIKSAAVTLGAEPEELNFVKTDGGYYITNGTQYVGLTSTNKWNMPTEPNLKTPVTVALDKASLYATIKEANGFIGSDETDVNTKTYANKAATDANSKWIITRPTEIYPVEILTGDEVLNIEDWTITEGADGAFHINTWSTENDASGMKNPFIEYWRGAGNNLKDSKINHVQMKDLEAGSYVVSIFARAFNENNTTDYPSGITFTANGKSVVMAETGEKSIFNNASTVLYDTLEVTTSVTEAGTLDFGFELKSAVTDWLAFKNLKVTYLSTKAPEVKPADDPNGLLKNTPAAAQAQDDAIDYFNYYNTPETYKAALDAVNNAEEIIEFLTNSAEAIKSLGDEGAPVFAEACQTALTAQELKDALAKAQQADGAVIDDGDYFFVDTKTGKYLGGANSWGTHASLIDDARFFSLTRQEDGSYYLDSHTYNNATSHFVGDADFIDSPAAPLTILKNAEGNVTIATTKGYIAPGEGTNLVANGKAEDAIVWKMVSYAEMIAALEDGTSTDATFLLKNASFSRNLYNPSFDKVWEGDEFSVGGDNTNFNAEKWGGNSQTFDVYQTITVPNGFYKIAIQGFYRYNNTNENVNDVAVAAHADGTEVINSFFYANEVEKPFISIADEAASAALEGAIPFSQAEATAAFNKGLYENELIVEVTDGTLKIGVKKTEHLGTDWTVWDNIRITKIEKEEPKPILVYTDLTPEMYHRWTGPEAEAEIAATDNPYCLYEVGNSASNVYGDPSVYPDEYADLSDYDELIITATEGTPRLLFNQLVKDGTDFVNIPNNAEQAAKYIKKAENGEFVYDLAAIKADYGFVHLNSIKGANWANTTITSAKLGKYVLPQTIKVGEADVPVIATVDVDVEHPELTEYAGDDAKFNVDDVLAKFEPGTTISDLTVLWVNPDNSTVAPAYGDGTIDGWRNAEGFVAAWGDSFNGFCVKIQDPASGKIDYLGAHNTNFKAGDTYVAAFAFVKGEQAVKLNVNINFVEPTNPTPEVSELAVETSVTYITNEAQYTEKVASITDADVAAILAELGLKSLNEAKVYGYNPTKKEFTAKSTYNPFDGWRDANGDFAMHTGDKAVPACVKYDNGQDFYCYNITGLEPCSVPAYWAISNGKKAVLVKVNVIYQNFRSFEGVLTQSLAHPKMGEIANSITEDYNVTISVPDENGNVEITFVGGIQYPNNLLLNVTIPEFKVNAVQTVAEDGSITYKADEFSIPVATAGNIVMNYNGTLEGWANGADTTPTIKVTLTNGTIDTILFGESLDAITGISIVSADVEGQNNGVVYDLNGRQVKNLVKGQIYIQNGKKVLVK